MWGICFQTLGHFAFIRTLQPDGTSFSFKGWCEVFVPVLWRAARGGMHQSSWQVAIDVIREGSFPCSVSNRPLVPAKVFLQRNKTRWGGFSMKAGAPIHNYFLSIHHSSFPSWKVHKVSLKKGQLSLPRIFRIWKTKHEQKFTKERYDNVCECASVMRV